MLTIKMNLLPANFFSYIITMQQLTLTQMWDESFDDDISTLNSANESIFENGPVYPIGGDEHFESDVSEHLSHSSQDTVPVISHDSSVIDGISFESTQINVTGPQINVTGQLLTQDFHTSLNNENIGNVSNEVAEGLGEDEVEVAEGLGEDEFEVAEDLSEDEFEVAEDLSEDEFEVAEDLGEDEVAELAEDEYHYFLQTHLGLYHDNLAHQEQVEYLVWVLEKYDQFLSQNK